MSVVDTLTLHFSTGPEVPIIGCFFHGFLGPTPWLFSLLLIKFQLTDLHVYESYRSKPTLAKPTLAKVKVLVVCKDFGFWELIVWGFLKLIV